MSNILINFNILAARLSVLYILITVQQIFLYPSKFLYQAKFLDTSTETFFPCIDRKLEQQADVLTIKKSEIHSNNINLIRLPRHIY